VADAAAIATLGSRRCIDYDDPISRSHDFLRSSSTMHRREFIKQTSLQSFAVGTAAALGLLAAPETTRAAKQLLPIIDTHQHLWDLTKFQPPWLAGAPKILAQSYVTKDYLQATKGLNVVKAVYMEIDVAPQQQVEEAEYVTGLAKSDDYPTTGAVISGRPNSENFKPYILRYKDNRYIKGVRQVLHVDSAPRGLCLQQQFVK